MKNTLFLTILLLMIMSCFYLPEIIPKVKTGDPILPVHNLDTGLDYDSIQNAIDASETLDGHSIFVDAGTYFENIIVNKELNFFGEDRKTIIDGNGTGILFSINCSNIQISGFNLRNASAAIVAINIWYDREVENLTVRNNFIEYCKEGIPNQTYKSSKFSNAEIANNTFRMNSYGVKLFSGTVLICYNIFYDNEVAIFNGGASTDVHHNFICLSNSTAINILSQGSGLAFEPPYYNVTNNLIWNNQQGINLDGSPSLPWLNANGTITNNTFTDNDYGIYLSTMDENSHFTSIYHNNFIKNNDHVYGNTLFSLVNWNSSYPSGGNFWDDYAGLDLYGGPLQDILGSDGFGDTTYHIDEGKIDYYPFIEVQNVSIQFPPIPLPPVASFSIPTKITVFDIIPFDASMSHDIDGNVLEYVWDFGDGTITSTISPIVSHVYQSVMDTNVTLIVIDDENQIGKRTIPIAVEKIDSNITISSYPQTLTIYESVLIEGTVLPLQENVSVFLWYRSSEETNWVLLEEMVTNSSSDYSCVWVPPSPGLYEIKTNCTGDQYIKAAESTILDIDCQKVKTFLSLISESSINYIGFDVDLFVFLTDEYNNVIPNEQIVFYYTFSGISEWVPIKSDITDENGNIEVTWFPPAIGNFGIKAQWVGNSTHLNISNVVNISSVNHDDLYVFSVESNSSISTLYFDEQNGELSFTAQGSESTNGYSRISIPKDIVANPEDITMLLDSMIHDFGIASNEDSWILSIDYSHSIRQIQVYLSSIQTDFIVLKLGWNMVSFPAIPDDASFSSIFSDVGFYQALTWDGTSYISPTVAEAGVGYWVLVLEETAVTIENAEHVTSYTTTLSAGWSMIGSIYGEAVNADDVFPGFYQLLTWDGTSYVTSTTIDPGKGYWALVLESTTITVGG